MDSGRLYNVVTVEDGVKYYHLTHAHSLVGAICRFRKCCMKDILEANSDEISIYFPYEVGDAARENLSLYEVTLSRKVKLFGRTNLDKHWFHTTCPEHAANEMADVLSKQAVNATTDVISVRLLGKLKKMPSLERPLVKVNKVAIS